MQRKSATLSLVALTALFAGCEWTGTSGSDSWSGSYDAMNFGGTYRITALTTLSEGDEKTSKNAADWLTDDDSGTFSANKTTASGRLSHQNVVPGSVKISCGNYMWMDDGGNILLGNTAAAGNRSGNLVFGGGTAVRTTTESGKTATSPRSRRNHAIPPTIGERILSARNSRPLNSPSNPAAVNWRSASVRLFSNEGFITNTSRLETNGSNNRNNNGILRSCFLPSASVT